MIWTHKSCENYGGYYKSSNDPKYLIPWNYIAIIYEDYVGFFKYQQ